MINLRYHIVSIVAVFLALGIGIAMGTSFIEGVIVDRLERSVADLEAERDTDERTIAELEDELDALRERTSEIGEAVLESGNSRRLSDDAVMIVTTEDVPPPVRELLRDAVLGTEAVYGGMLVLSPALALATDDDVERVASLLGVPDDDPVVVATELTDRLHDVLVPAELVPVPEVAGGRLTTVGEAVLLDPEDPGLGSPPDSLAPADDLFLELVAGGLADYDATGVDQPDLRSVPRRSTRWIVLGAPDASFEGRQVLSQVAAELLRIVPTPAVVVSSAGPEGPAPFLEPFRDPDRLGGLVATVDGVDTFEGLMATIMAADRIGELGPADYGRREDAVSLLPAR